MLIYGILKNKPSYLMPYFSIKVFQVVMASLTTLGFYSCLPNVRYWIETHRYFPLKKELLLLENQTLELFVFSILITSVLVKLYVVIIVWYCYRYMVTIESFRTMNHTSGACVSSRLSFDEASNNGYNYKVDDESLVSQQPPKYEDIIKQIKQESAATAVPSSNVNPSTSNSFNHNNNNNQSRLIVSNVDEESEESVASLVNSSDSSELPSYSPALVSNKTVVNNNQNV